MDAESAEGTPLQTLPPIVPMLRTCGPPIVATASASECAQRRTSGEFATLVKDAQRHGVRFRPVDVTRSGRRCTLEEGEVRLGLRYVRGLRSEAAVRIEAERALRPFASLQDFVDRTGLRRDEQRDLAESIGEWAF